MFGDYVSCLITDITDSGAERFGRVAAAEVAVLCACAVSVGA